MPAQQRKSHGLTYLRRSGNKQEMSLGLQLAWSVKEAPKHGAELDASPEDLEYMLSRGLNSYKSIRLDDAVTGANLERPGFLAFNKDLLSDRDYSHGFIFRRDRFARPEDACEMVVKEKQLSQSGITLVFCDKTIEPIVRGASDLSRDLTTLFDYYESGNFLRKLAENVIVSHQRLAHQGFSTGGVPPFGFERALFNSAGELVEYLRKGKKVRQEGCHVRWVPGRSAEDRAKISFWILILNLKHDGWGYKRIANHLNHLRIPSPAAGAIRTDHGVAHYVSGKWNPNTVRDLCENKSILGIKQYGRRSEGAHRRLADDGWRHLNEEDYNQDNKPKFVNNPSSLIVEAASGTESQYDEHKWREIRQQVAERGRNQRGISRTKDPAKYPLSCRVVDLSDHCGAIMYGATSGGRRLYKCGRYMRTSGSECNNNAVDAEALLKFVLKTIRQFADPPGRRAKLQHAILRLARQRAEAPKETPSVRERVEQQTCELREELTTVQHRMAREKNDELYQALRDEFLDISARLSELERTVDTSDSKPDDPITETEAAMQLLDQIGRVCTDDAARLEVPRILRRLGLRVGLRFGDEIKGKKRKVRKLWGGVVVFGDAELPVKLHGKHRVDDGGCAQPPNEPRQRILDKSGKKGKTAGKDDRPSSPTDARTNLCHQEGVSFTKVNRGDWI